jgi:molybdopterin biosynthesis enzyme
MRSNMKTLNESKGVRMQQKASFRTFRKVMAPPMTSPIQKSIVDGIYLEDKDTDWSFRL